MRNRDSVLLRKIIQYVDEITMTIQRYDLSYDRFIDDFVVKNAISMCILQIGELVGRLSDELKDKYNGMPWKDIKAMRNIAAHNYGEIDLEILWETATVDVLALKRYCRQIIYESEK